MKTFVVILITILFYSIGQGQDIVPFEKIQFTTSHNASKYFPFDGASISYIIPMKNIKKYQFFELTDFIWGTLKNPNEVQNTFNIGISYGISIRKPKKENRKIQLRIDHQAGLRYNYTFYKYLTSYGASQKEIKFGLLYHITPNLDFNASKNIVVTIGIPFKIFAFIRKRTNYSAVNNNQEGKFKYFTNYPLKLGIIYKLK